MTPDVLIAGIGNIFFGDDAFGVELARELAARPLPAGVVVRDFGIRGLHLAFELLDPPRLLILADCARLGKAPGTLYVVDPEDEQGLGPCSFGRDGHAMAVPEVFAAVRAMGGNVPRTRIVACEPQDLAETIGLSAVVRAAIAPAADLVLELIERETNHVDAQATSI